MQQFEEKLTSITDSLKKGECATKGISAIFPSLVQC